MERHKLKQLQQYCRDKIACEQLQDFSADIEINNEQTESSINSSALIFEKSYIAVATTDPSGNILCWNQQAETLCQWALQEVLGQQIHQMIIPQPNQWKVSNIFNHLLRHNFWHGELTIQRKDTSQFLADITTSVIKDSNGRITGFVVAAVKAEKEQITRQQQQQAERDRLIGDISLRIRRSLNLSEILNRAVTEIRDFLQIERVAVYQIDYDKSGPQGRFTVESVSSGCPPLLGQTLRDPCFQADYIDRYRKGHISVIDDIYAADYKRCYVELLEQVKIRANLLVPIISQDQLWGLLCAHQCSQPRHWQPFEIDSLQKLATQLGIAIQQSELYEQVQRLNTELETQVQERTAQLQQALDFEAMLTRITDKVRDSFDESQIVQTAVQELTQVLHVRSCDAALYNIPEGTATVSYRHHKLRQASNESVVVMADFPEIFPQLLQGHYFQFCEIVPQATRKRIAILACPIFDDQGVLGDLWLFKQEQQSFNELEIRLVQQVASHCAIAIRQARLYQQAQAQVKELEKLNRLKDDFLSTVSHELRTPVSNMKMAIHMLSMASTAERRDRYLQILKSECVREADLINDLLDLQRLEAASYPVFLVESINLQQWLPEILEPFQSRVQERQQKLELEVPTSVPPLISDRASLARIMAELLNNACKYTPSDGKILLQVSLAAKTQATQAETASFTTFTLSNQAEIPSTELPKIFEKFYRVPNADPWKQGGTGLGLALVLRLIERLKGKIQVQSQNGWTTFQLQLPTKPIA